MTRTIVFLTGRADIPNPSAPELDPLVLRKPYDAADLKALLDTVVAKRQ